MEKQQELQNQHKPVSLQSVRDKVAKELGYTRWVDCATERPLEFSDKVSRRYAQAVAGDVRARCAENAKTRNMKITEESPAVKAAAKMLESGKEFGKVVMHVISKGLTIDAATEVVLKAENSISRAKAEKLSTAAVNAISEISQGNPVGASSFLYKALEETGEL